jgi:putative addiction module killer protein
MEIRRYLTESGRDVFGEWVSGLKDVRTRAKIVARIDRLSAGIFGDCKALRGGLFELRIDWGPGYRVYYALTGKECVCYFAAEISASSRPISSGRSNTSRITGREHNETQGEHIARRSHGS